MKTQMNLQHYLPLCIGLCLGLSAQALEAQSLGKLQELTGTLSNVLGSPSAQQPKQSTNYLELGAKVLNNLRKGIEDLTPEEEYYIGRTVAARVLGQYRPLDRVKVNRYLNELGGYLAQFSRRPETFAGYHFQLIESQEINAFAAPGGFILVTSGLYRSLTNEDQLAAVLAHEIAHVTLNHGLSAIKTANLTQAFTLIGQTYLDEKTGGKVSALNQLTSVFGKSVDDIVNTMVVSGYSQNQELNADAEALRILRQSGYNPDGLTGFFGILGEGAGKQGAGFYVTHPPVAKRLEAARALVSKKAWQGEGSSLRDQRFRQHKL